MADISQISNKITELTTRINKLHNLFGLAVKETRLSEIDQLLVDPKIWQDRKQLQTLNKEKVQLEAIIAPLQQLNHDIADVIELFEGLGEEILTEVDIELAKLTKTVAQLEFQGMFDGPMDQNNAFVDIQSGSGGTEAQDWAEMLMRMYLRWADSREFSTTVMDTSKGEVAGIKSTTIKVVGSYAYGWLRNETGIHRLVRKSPFDAGSRRHTSFAAVFVYPEVDDTIELEINPSDLRIDTYRASGAGGQHVNRTDSAVRITHIPTGIVVQSQDDRSQHKNRAQAMSRLRAKLYELKLQEQNKEKQKLEDSKSDIGWGSQIRSYVLDQSRIKDLRTNLEITNVQKVLDGYIDPFLEASLKEGS